MAGHTHQKKHIKSKFNNNKFVEKEEGEDYGIVVQNFGYRNFQVYIFSTKTFINARARNTLYKYKKIFKDDIVLIQLGDPNDIYKYFILDKLSPENVRDLVRSGELDISSYTNANSTEDRGDIMFDDEEDTVIEFRNDNLDPRNNKGKNKNNTEISIEDL